ncbi:MAG: hypothetical protein ACEQSF_04445, partial [Solirubrobacteraceae bacterium]
AQIQTLEKSLLTCNQQESNFSKLLNKSAVKFEDIKISEKISGLNTINIRKRTITTNDAKDIFIIFKIFTFPGINASKYTFHENHLSIDEAKILLVDLIKLDEEFKKSEINKEITYYNNYINTSTFIKVGIEHSYVNSKSIMGSFKYDYNGEEILEKNKIWYIDIDYSCKDNRTTFLIKDIDQFIETLRNTING